MNRLAQCFPSIFFRVHFFHRKQSQVPHATKNSSSIFSSRISGRFISSSSRSFETYFDNMNSITGPVSHQNFTMSHMWDICPYLGNTGLESRPPLHPAEGLFLFQTGRASFRPVFYHYLCTIPGALSDSVRLGPDSVHPCSE